MNSWFTVKVKYTKQLDDGRLKRVTEPYLVDAVTFTDAEARIYEVVGQSVRGEFVITGISKTEFADVFYYEDSNDWYKCKLTYVSVNADEGKEKKITSNFLITANNVKDAYQRIQESLSEMTVSFEVPAISLTPIVDVIPYEEKEEDNYDETLGININSDVDFNNEEAEENNHQLSNSENMEAEENNYSETEHDVTFIDETK